MGRSFTPRSIVLAAALVAACSGRGTAPHDAPDASIVAVTAAAKPSEDVDLASVMARVRHAWRHDGGRITGGGSSYESAVEASGAFTVRPRTARGSATRFETVAIRRGGAALASAGSTRVEPSVVSIARGPLVEQLENRDDGVEQSWRLEAAPPGGGDLVVDVAVSGGTFLGATEHGLHFGGGSPAGTGGVRYGVATLVDARGTSTRITPTYRDGRIELVVPADVIASAAFPVVLDPTIGGELTLDTPVETVPSSDDPSIAFDGTNYLAVWTDSYGDYVVRAARVSKAGAVLDAYGVFVGYGFRPKVAWDGTEYIVLYEQNEGGKLNLKARRVSSAGAVIDTSEVALLPNASYSSIACDGTNCLVACQRGSGYPTALAYTMISKTLGVVGATETSVSTTGNGASVAFDGTNYMIAFADTRGADSDIYGIRVSKAGASLDPGGFVISAATESQSKPSIGFDGTNYLVAWNDFRGGFTTAIYAARVTPAKAILDATGVLVATDVGNGPASLTGAGGGWVVSWEDSTPSTYASDTWVASFSASAIVSTPVKVLTAGGYYSAGAIAFDGTNALVTNAKKAARVSKAGAIVDTTPFALSRAANRQVEVSVASDGTNYLIAWTDFRGTTSTTGNATNIYATRVAPTGTVLDPAGLAVTTLGKGRNPQVAFDGTNFLVAWIDSRNPAPPGFGSASDVYGRFVAKTGVLAAEVPLVVGTDSHYLSSVGFDGTNYVVVTNRQTQSGTGDGVYARRVTPAGSVLDPSGVLVVAPPTTGWGSGYVGGEGIACDGTNCMIGVNSSNGSVNAVGLKRFSKAGVVLDSALIDPGPTVARRSSLRLAWNGQHYLAAWTDYRNDPGDSSNADIYAARISTAGSVLDSSPIALATVAGIQQAPVVVDPGDTVGTAVFWMDLRAAPAGTYRGDVYATWVKYDGTVLDPSGVAVANSAFGEEWPWAASRGGGNMLVTYTRFDGTAPFMVKRARARLVSSGILPGAACTSDAQCATRACADGVCCDTRCDGTCKSCTITPGRCLNVSAGGTDPGTCAGTCDGAGNCKKSNGVACSVGTECGSSFCVDGYCCNTSCGGGCDVCNATGKLGTCTPIAVGSPGVPSCTPYLCGGAGTCPTTCETDTDCAGGFYCTPAKICQAQKDNAQSCNLVTDCAVAGCRECKSGFCVDGVCCNAACDGACDTCSGATKGTCALLGRGATGSPTCAPFTCSGSSAGCGTTCASDLDCTTNAYCRTSDSKCQTKLALGGACASNSECATGNCVDGVCCDTACSGTCVACAAALKTSGADGTCGPAADGKDPHGTCPDDGMSTCARDGFCNGSGGCRLYKSGTSCGASTCDGNVAKGVLCDGLGACKTSTTGVDCATYACSAGSCKSTCATNSDCASTAWCDGGTCRTKGANGAKCTLADACASAFCVDGVCCASACTGQCEACDVAGAEGSCAPVTGDAHSTRPKCAGGTASNPCAATKCDGTVRDSCAAYEPTTTPCREATCTDGVATFAAKCDGKGGCPASETQVCEPYACGAKACKTSCTADADCGKNTRCDVASGKCVSAATCDGDHIVTGADGTTTDCAPFRCESSGRCKDTCAVSSDCVAPLVCDGSGKCVQPPGAGDEESGGCGCRTARTSGDATWLLGAFAGAVAWQRRRRRAVVAGDRTEPRQANR